MDAKTKLMLLAIRNRIKNGEDIYAILESYPKLTQKQIDSAVEYMAPIIR